MTRRAIGAAIAALIMITTSTTLAQAETTAEPGPTEDRLADGTTIFGRQIELHLSDADGLGWARISNGDPTDEVWLQRSFDGGETVADDRLGHSTVPDGSRAVTTPVFPLDEGDRTGVLRACGKAGNRDDTVCTGWFAA